MIRSPLPIGTLLCCLFTLGCTGTSPLQPSDNDHDHDHEHNEARLSYEDLVTQIGEHRDTIKAAFAADAHDEAHDPLHKIGHLITKLPDAAAETDLAESDWKQVKQASETLMTAFGRVDSMFHGIKDGLEFAEIESEVQAAMEILEAKVAMISDRTMESKQ